MRTKNRRRSGLISTNNGDRKKSTQLKWNKNDKPQDALPIACRSKHASQNTLKPQKGGRYSKDSFEDKETVHILCLLPRSLPNNEPVHFSFPSFHVCVLRLLSCKPTYRVASTTHCTYTIQPKNHDTASYYIKHIGSLAQQSLPTKPCNPHGPSQRRPA